jgi:hypothetical protein
MFRSEPLRSDAPSIVTSAVPDPISGTFQASGVDTARPSPSWPRLDAARSATDPPAGPVRAGERMEQLRWTAAS